MREAAGEAQEAYQAQTAQALRCEDESYLRYTKYLEFRLTYDGKTVEPTGPVTAYVTLPDVSEGADALQVVRFGGRGPVLLDSEREGTEIAFRTDGMGAFGIGNALMPLTAQQTELASVEVLGFSADTDVWLTAAEDPDVEEGLEVLGTFSVDDREETGSGEEEQEGLWITAELNEGTALSPMESVALYSVENGEARVLVEDVSEDCGITELEAQQVAVVRDTGFRRLTLVVGGMVVAVGDGQGLVVRTVSCDTSAACVFNFRDEGVPEGVRSCRKAHRLLLVSKRLIQFIRRTGLSVRRHEQGRFRIRRVLPGGEVGVQIRPEALADDDGLVVPTLPLDDDGLRPVRDLTDREGANLCDTEAGVQDQGDDGAVTDTVPPVSRVDQGFRLLMGEVLVLWTLLLRQRLDVGETDGVQDAGEVAGGVAHLVRPLEEGIQRTHIGVDGGWLAALRCRIEPLLKLGGGQASDLLLLQFDIVLLRHLVEDAGQKLFRQGVGGRSHLQFPAGDVEFDHFVFAHV